MKKLYWIWLDEEGSSLVASSFPKLVSPKAKADKTLFGPTKPTNPSFWIAYKGRTSWE